MTNSSTKSVALQSEAETAIHVLDDWFDPIEAGLPIAATPISLRSSDVSFASTSQSILIVAEGRHIALKAIPEGGGTGVEDGVLSASLELGDFVRAETGEALLSG
jgi:hypothetical protein